MEQEWHKGSGLGKLHVKALFHHFVFELLHQLDRQGIQPLKPDLVAQAVTYIREHFSRSITLESIAEELECSTGHLSRLFKSKMHTSPIHYLGQIRANRAAELLIQTDATLQEIAERVGYPDAHSLSRSFKKYIRDYLLYDSKKNGSSISRRKIRICPKRSLNMPFSGQLSPVILILIINIGIMRKGIYSCTEEAKLQQ
ncbi:helix-turn-helix domain-containing protein [Paenibacillus polymyxa]|uniref:helix-turn-helix domain-containing protein n=1 Tax=Paenibacillus polymyxa TaxID=1406 RepID=UPI003B58B9AE